MISSSACGVQLWYHTPSGYTTATGPCVHICRQFALVLANLCPEIVPSALSSFNRFLRKSQLSIPLSCEQHLGFVWSAHRKMCLSTLPIPSAFALSLADRSRVEKDDT